MRTGRACVRRAIPRVLGESAHLHVRVEADAELLLGRRQTDDDNENPDLLNQVVRFTEPTLLFTKFECL